MTNEKMRWRGSLVSVQPRIRLTRSFDQRSHVYLGYALRVAGTIRDQEKEFLVGIGKGAQAKHKFQAGCLVEGECLPVGDPRLESVEFYKTSKLNVLERSPLNPGMPPPWLGIPDDLVMYRQRGHRRLDARTYVAKCLTCIWGCRMAVEMIVDHWNPSQRKYRSETFCYGPRSCRFYRAGPTRKVPGRRGMIWEESDWVDDEDTLHRELDE
ncbi:MAG: hypothetical protein KAT01_02215 [Candidatus Aminicenantes bacterium]|nr:hypothetical protein [Candidatus Aminicenantes bacterium]